MILLRDSKVFRTSRHRKGGVRAPQVVVVALFYVMSAVAADAPQNSVDTATSTIDASGIAHIPPMTVPFSSLASPEAKKNFLDFTHGFASLSEGEKTSDDIKAFRKRLDERLMQPGVAKLRAIFPVEIRAERIAGVQTDIIDPAGAIAAKNKSRVLEHFDSSPSGTGLAGGEVVRFQRSLNDA